MNDAWNRQRPHNWQSKSSAPWDIWVCRQSPVYGQDLPWHLHWSSWVWPASAAGWWHRAAVASGGKPHQQLTAAHLRKDESIDYNTNWKDTEKKPVVFMIYDQWRKKKTVSCVTISLILFKFTMHGLQSVFLQVKYTILLLSQCKGCILYHTRDKGCFFGASCITGVSVHKRHDIIISD